MTKIVPALAGIITLALGFRTAIGSAAQLGNNVLPLVSQSTNLGHTDPNRQMTVRVWLNLRNEAAFDQALEQQYNPQSLNYHQWLTGAQLSQYAPAAADRNVVQEELESHGLTIIPNAVDGLSLEATGSVASVESAFHTQINDFSRNGRAFYANALDATLAGPAANLVKSVTGLNNIGMRPLFKTRTDPRTGLPSLRGGSLLPPDLSRNTSPPTVFLIQAAFNSQPSAVCRSVFISETITMKILCLAATGRPIYKSTTDWMRLTGRA